MSNYTIQVDWAGKDALPDSSASKVISGDDFNTEFVSVRTAINSKADVNGDAAENFTCNDLTVSGENATVDGQTIATLGTPETFTKAHPTAAEELTMTADQTANLLNANVFVVTATSDGYTLDTSNQTAGVIAKFIIDNPDSNSLSFGSEFVFPGESGTIAINQGGVTLLDCVSDGSSLYCTTKNATFA
jgi:hypothetical protein